MQPGQQLTSFIRFAAEHSPHYRQQDWVKALKAGGTLSFSDIPLTLKGMIQAAPESFRAEDLPPEAGRVSVKLTSGSTEIPMPVFKSASHFQVNLMENIRLKAPWRYQDHKKQLYYSMPDQENPLGTITRRLTEQGIEEIRIYSRSIAEIGEILAAEQPSFFSGRPTMVAALLENAPRFQSLRLIETLTEAVPDGFQALVARIPGARHIDVYGAVETGLIAVKCPRCGCYHLAHRNCFIEVLREDGTPAGDGEIGRVVATVFSNPAMPLIRYDLGDMVRFTRNALCEPGAISLLRIHGRERMMFRLPGGGKVMPSLDVEGVMKLGVKQFKLVQTALDTIEFRYKPLVPGATIDAAGLERLVAAEMSPQFKVIPLAVEDFPPSPSGKYLMHERLIP